MAEVKDWRADLISRVETYCRARGISESTFGKYALNSGHLMRRIREGKPITRATEDRIVGYISRNPVAAFLHRNKIKDLEL